MPWWRRRKGRRQEWPGALARPADACAEPYRRATWHCRMTPGCSFGCGRAGPPRPLSTCEVDRGWHEPTRSAARSAENGCAPGHFENPPKSSATSLDLMPLVRSLGPCSTIVVGRISLVASYAKGQRQQHVRCLARVLALHVLPVCAYSAPACTYLALVCAFASLLVLTNTACL